MQGVSSVEGALFILPCKTEHFGGRKHEKDMKAFSCYVVFLALWPNKQ